MTPRIPFRIGWQYDNCEMDLITLSNKIPENNLYISYLWVGSEVKKFLNFIPHRTELIFYWDRLEVVILEFDNKSTNYFNKLINALKLKFPDFNNSCDTYNILYKFIGRKVNYWVVYYPITKEIKVVYFPKSFTYINRIIE